MSEPLHIFSLLDRSGSMATIAPDVIGGFNSSLATQRAEGPDALMTLVQFDSGDPHEVLAEARPITEVPELSPATFVPRGGTPLYDAMGHTIADAVVRTETRKAAGKAPEAILCVTFTDGQENQSVEYDRTKVFDLVKKREADGWSFAYLGANQDAYAEAGRIGLAPGNIANFEATPAGAAAAYARLSDSVSWRRAAMRSGKSFDPGKLFDESPGSEPS